MQKFYIISLVLATLNIGSLVQAEYDFYQYLDKAIEDTEELLTSQQLDILNGVRRELNNLEDVNIDEPYFTVQYWHYDIAIRYYMASEGWYEEDVEQFESYVRSICIDVNNLWDEVFTEFYRRRNRGYGSFAAIRRRDPGNFYMVLNAAFCYNGYNQGG